MSTDTIEKRTLGERLQDVYRVNILDDETLREVKTFRFSLSKIYTLFITIFLIMALIIVSIIFFTPIKRLVPGFGDIKENREFVKLTRQVDELEKELETQQVYTKGLMNMLSGGEMDKSKLLEDGQPLVLSGSNTIDSESINEGKEVQALDHFMFAPPVSGSISAKYDISINHLGVDVLAAKDTPIKSMADGIVITSDWTLETGNTIGVQHADNLISFYKHNSANLKRTGELVTAGEAIAIIGNTGTLSDGPHLHFELWYQGKPINPELLINFSN